MFVGILAVSVHRLATWFATWFAACRRHLVSAFVDVVEADAGQTTAEYALVIVGAAAIAGLLIAWAAHSHAISRVFDSVIGRLVR